MSTLYATLKMMDNPLAQFRQTSLDDLAISLYFEHIEEASFLYEQRVLLLDDPELNWTDLHGFEERLEAHVDALVLGTEPALAVCGRQVREGDLGELHAAVRVYCRQGRPDLLDEVVGQLGGADDEREKAVADALCHELPLIWQASIEERITGQDAVFTRLVARALGYRRIPASSALMDVLAHADDEPLPDIIWSLGRLCDSRSRAMLYKTYLRHESNEIQAAAAVALLRMGEPAAIQYCAGIARSQPWALVPIGLGGNGAHLGLLMEIATTESVSTHCVLALGLLGDAAAIDPLLYHMGDESLAMEAAVAMYLITGADLFEEEFIPEAIEEDELFEDEIEEIETAETVTRTHPETEPSNATVAPRGTTITRLSQESEAWRSWWEDNKSTFRKGVRYRNGAPSSPAHLLAIMMAEKSPRIARRLAAEEFTIRYGFDLKFETDMFVARQVEAIREAGVWLENRASQFTDGKYYLGGRLQTR